MWTSKVRQLVMDVAEMQQFRRNQQLHHSEGNMHVSGASDGSGQTSCAGCQTGGFPCPCAFSLPGHTSARTEVIPNPPGSFPKPWCRRHTVTTTPPLCQEKSQATSTEDPGRSANSFGFAGIANHTVLSDEYCGCKP